jgi:hypothetical protein
LLQVLVDEVTEFLAEFGEGIRVEGLGIEIEAVGG